MTTEYKASIDYINYDEFWNRKKELIRQINEICEELGIQYFAFGEFLVGIVHYSDFIPDQLNKFSDIGLLREDYDKLTKYLIKHAEEKEILIQDTSVKNNAIMWFRAGKDVQFTTESVVVTDQTWLTISAFDAIPDEFDARKGYFRKLGNATNSYEQMVKQASIPITDIRKYLWKSPAFYLKKRKKAEAELLQMAGKFNGEKTADISRLIPKRSTAVAYDDIFPTVWMDCGGVQVSCPNNCYTWTAKIDDELMRRTRLIQKVDLVLLKEFDRACREIGVGYFVCGGTMLGYQRHNGFIPWDDDIDVGMLREDYDKFLAEGAKHLPEGFFLQTRQSDPKIPYLFSKIRLDGTGYITKYNELRDFHKGICLDLFPFDYIPNKPHQRELFRAEVRSAEDLHNKIANRQIERVKYDAPAKNSSDRWYRFINEVRRKLVHLIPMKWTQNHYLKTATRYNHKAKELGLTTVASFVPTYTFIDVDKMLPYRDVEFEGQTIKVINDIDGFLTMQYGDYMQLPPLHKRVGHDLIDWYIDDEVLEKYHISKDEEA